MARPERLRLGAKAHMFLEHGGRCALRLQKIFQEVAAIEREPHDSGHAIGGDIVARDARRPVGRLVAMPLHVEIQPGGKAFQHRTIVGIEFVIGVDGSSVDAKVAREKIGFDVLIALVRSERLRQFSADSHNTAEDVQQVIFGLTIGEPERRRLERIALDVRHAIVRATNLHLLGQRLRIGRARRTNRKGLQRDRHQRQPTDPRNNCCHGSISARTPMMESHELPASPPSERFDAPCRSLTGQSARFKKNAVEAKTVLMLRAGNGNLIQQVRSRAILPASGKPGHLGTN